MHSSSSAPANLQVIRAITPSADADRETIAAPRIIQSVSISVVSSKIKLTTAIATTTQSVNASLARGIDAARSKPALAMTTDCRTVFNRGCST